jgi:hypothetical protein
VSDDRVPGATEIAVALVVGEDEDHVGFLRSRQAERGEREGKDDEKFHGIGMFGTCIPFSGIVR